MADRKISDLTALTAPASGDYLPIVDISEAAAANKNKRITIEELFRGVPLGTAAAPSIAIEGNENTGIYSPGAYQLAISTNGVGRLFVDSSGRCGIGTSSVNDLLHLRNSSSFAIRLDDTSNTHFIAAITSPNAFGNGTTAGQLYLRGAAGIGLSGNGGTSIGMVVDSSNRCGIGASSPSVRLQVQDSIAGGSDGTVATLHNFSDTGADTRYVGLNFRIGSDNGTSAIRAYRTNSANNYETNLSFWTNPSGATQTPVQRMTLDSSGRLGIGTTASPAGASIRLTLDGSNGGGVELVSNNNGGGALVPSAGGGIQFYTHTGAVGSESYSERARIDSSGRLLVGTSSSLISSSLLQVAGNSYPAMSINSFGTSSNPEYIFRSARGTKDSPTVSVDGDKLGAIYFQGYDGAEYIGGAKIEAFVDGAVTGGGVDDLPGRLVFSVTRDGSASPTEALRISNQGDISHSHQRIGEWAIASYNTSSSAGNVYGARLRFSNKTPNDATSIFLSCEDSTAIRAEIRSNGGLANYSANNANLSDRNAKKDISPAAGTWDCIKEWEIVNYRYKDQPDDADLNLGVIAQQVAENCPEVITVFQEAKEATEDQPAQEERLGVKEQQMYWMAIKALQEAQVRIEALEAEVAALKAQ